MVFLLDETSFAKFISVPSTLFVTSHESTNAS